MEPELISIFQPIYQQGITYTIGILLFGLICIMFYRFKKSLVAYINNEKIDRFDDSVLWEEGWNYGNEPFGIILDTVIWGCWAVLCGLAWPVFWIASGIMLIATCIRNRRIQEQLILSKLRGDKQSKSKWECDTNTSAPF